MKKLILPSLACALLVGCATNVPVELPSNALITKDAQGNVFLDRIVFNYSNAKFNKAQTCAATTIENNSVNVNVENTTLTRYGAITTAQDTGYQGGNVLQSVSDDGVVAKGKTTSPDGMLIRIYDYTALISPNDKGVIVTLSNLKQDIYTAMNTSATQPKLKPIGAWSGANPLGAYNALKVIADKLDICMR
ncbi:hypothetical protein V6W59_10840 [Mannheimia sp. HC-2023]|uniref:hypothetical protein n=1 Tax=Mannheimia indoligenes TaxID=3103145 RepID=UPI002FE61BCD